jgi:hypothetical protein
MPAVWEGPLSPELVLVCPELREQALAELPDPEWAAIVAQVRARAKVAASPPLPRHRRTLGALRAYLVDVAAMPLLAIAAGTLVTLALTLVADALR